MEDPKRVKGLIVALASPKEPAVDDELNHWLDTVHCPDVAETPGVIAWTRYVIVDPQPGQPKYMTITELDRGDADAAMEWLKQNMVKKREQGRYKYLSNPFHVGAYQLIFQQISEPDTPEAMVVVMSNLADPAREAEYNHWYNTKYLPAILKTPGMTGGMRFKNQASDFTSVDYLQTYHIGSPDAAAVPEAMVETHRNASEHARSTAGMAEPILVATFKRRGPRHIVSGQGLNGNFASKRGLG